MRNEKQCVNWEAVDLTRLGELAGLLTQSAPANLCVGLVGTLGAGKTRFVQAVAQHLGVAEAEVTSPTFSLVQTYRGTQDGRTVDLHHIDAYRIADEDEWFETGLEELLDDDEASTATSWRFVEWADRFENLMPPNTLWVRIKPDPSDDQSRQITVSGGDRHQMLVESLRRDA